MENKLASSISFKLVALLAALFMLSPFAIATYLPAVHFMALDLGVPDSMVAITISLYVFGMSFGQLAGGTLSDIFGRKEIMIVGLSIFAVCSVFLSLVHSEFGLVFWRIVQSLGGGIAVVGVPATIRDHTSGKEAAKLFALIALIMLIAPTLAPTIGTLILQFFTWHWIFYFLTAFPVILIILISLYMPSSIRKPFENPVKIFALVLKEKRAFPFLFSQAFTYATVLTFVTNSSIIYVGHFFISIKVFAILFLLNIVGMIFANRLNVFLLKKYEPKDLLRVFLSCQIAGCFMALIVVIFFPTHLVFLVICIILAIGSSGGVIPNSTSCFLGYFGEHAGIASGMLGATQYIIAGTISGVSALLAGSSILPIFIIMALCAVITLYEVLLPKRMKHSA